MKKDINIYKNQDLKETWSYNHYKKYENSSSLWNWEGLPFGDKLRTKKDWDKQPEKTTGSILEVGSAAGGAYDFMLESGLIDLTDYTGLEISKQGFEFCKKKHPKANWIQADVTTFIPTRRYDYFFERIAIHHMPEPLDVISKFAAVVDKAFSTSFVSCLDGETISDLSVARYRHPNGDFVYFDIINVFEVIEILLSNGFNQISVSLSSEHEDVESDPLAHQYVAPELNWKKRRVHRATVYALKSSSNKEILINPYYGLKTKFLNPSFVKLSNERILRLLSERDGKLYPSKYFEF